MGAARHLAHIWLRRKRLRAAGPGEGPAVSPPRPVAALPARYGRRRTAGNKWHPKSARPFLGTITNPRFRMPRPAGPVTLARPPARRGFVAGHSALTSNVVPVPGAPGTGSPHTGIAGRRVPAQRLRLAGGPDQAPSVLRRQCGNRLQGAFRWSPAAGHRAPGRRPLCRYRACAHHGPGPGQNRHLFPRIEFRPDTITGHFANLAGNSGEPGGRFRLRWQMAGAGGLKRVAIMAAKVRG